MLYHFCVINVIYYHFELRRANICFIIDTISSDLLLVIIDRLVSVLVMHLFATVAELFISMSL